MLAAVVALWVALLTGAGHTRLAGAPLAAERIEFEPTAAPVMPLSRAVTQPAMPSGATPDDQALAAVLADLEAFWTGELGRAQGSSSVVEPFRRPTGGYTTFDGSAASGSALCVDTPGQIAGNAFYCSREDGVVVDTAVLVPLLLDRYGPGGFAVALGHEFGHAVQAQAGVSVVEQATEPERYPGVLLEAQADCMAGAYLAALGGGGPTGRVWVPEASLLTAVAPLLDLRDPADVPLDAPQAHGLALDRLQFVLAGMRGSAVACLAWEVPDLGELTLGREGVQLDASVPRYADRDAVIAAARTSVEQFSGIEPAVPDGMAPGAGAGSEHPGAGGPADGEDGADGGDATRDTASAAELAAAEPFGQAALAATVARSVGLTWSSGDPVRATCFTGAWMGSIFGTAPPGELGSWASDADEALDYLRARPGATFDDVAAYADGFARGLGACG